MKPDIKNKINPKNPNKIKDLRLENGRLKSVPSEIKNFKRLKFLNLFNNSLTELPDFFENFELLENLNLSNNKFILFPEVITLCKSLKVLNFRGNRVTDLIGLQKLFISLEKIDLSSNKLETLRVDFSSFDKLKEADLSNNGICKFPKSLLLVNLKHLNLSSNSIENLPDDINNLKSIRHLDLSYNNITDLPEEICELTELRYLNLTGNNIITLPKSFAKLKKLQDLNLSGNPIGDVPVEISKQGLKGVLNYYMHLGASVRLNEAKLLVVGQGAVGKTYLINKMINGSNPETLTTEGIDIFKWHLSCETENDGNQRIRLNAWDFGGQEIYHSTHQFFLTKRSIYLFLWEARKDESLINFDYWLNIIQMLSNGSPVIIVLNKIDERVKEIDEKSLKEKFPNIKAFKSVSAKEGTNIEDLVDCIKSNIATLPHIGDKLPEVWSNIREDLEELTDNYISYETYIDICHSYGLNKVESKHLSNYFHDLGVFLHFIDNPILKPIVFLKPEWATNCVYRILDLNDVIKKFGEFDNELLEKQIPDYDSQQMSYIIELMKKFELCFEINKGTFIIPELLRPSSPDLEIKIIDPISLIYKYDFMPAGILSRLTVRLKDSIFDNFYWKNGLYVKHNDSIGIIESNQFSRTIKIKVSGNNKATLLSIIKRELDIINETLNFPHHETNIQCNCENCLKEDSPFMFDYEYLERARNAKVQTVQCQMYLKNVDLSKLIGPYDMSSGEYKTDFGFTTEDLTYDIWEISSRILERKNIVKIEDLITDNFTDNLRSKGYFVTDQTRSGKAKKFSGELDIMVRNSRNMPVAIVEAMRLSSFNSGNKTIINHLNKLLIDYDTNGLSRNFMLIYSETEKFSEFQDKYIQYIKELPLKEEYDERAKLISYSMNIELSKNSSLKVIKSMHQRDSAICEVYHFLIKMN
ncbi:COR domain-containing protein [Lacinutrix jangbogonensis]|uniref:COR domain-containing protein n=1 Tax=Lacinutrix jangbogonensis TaxID=1469557 RepID=UPI00053D6744|nr:COR domain-containing protein [Lacinutrix jangbogonensis]